MNKRFFRHTLLWSLMLMLALSACQTPTPIQSLQKTTENQAASTARAALPEVSAERLKEARAKLRPNTQDRLEYLYDSQKRPVSWMVVYDPPRTDPPQAGAFQTQMISDLFGDPKENVFYLVAEFEPVENITIPRYLSWYTQPVAAFGGRRGHPDPWLNQEGCVPNYEIRFNGRLHSKLPEYRYARVPSGFYNPNDPYWYLDKRRTIEVRVPPRVIPRSGGRLVSISKGAACDQTSPALQMEIDNRDCDTPEACPDATPTPGPTYCSRRLQTVVLDVEENRLLGIDNEVRSLEQDLPEEGFQTQMHRPLAAPYPKPRSASFGTQGYYGDSPFFTPPSGAPTPSPTPTPSTGPPVEPYTNLIPIEEAQAQLDRLKALATGLESRLQTLSDYYNQTLSSMEEPDDDDGFEQQEYLEGQLATTEQLQESLKPAAKTLAQVTAELEMVCNHDEPPVNQPRLDVIYAGFEPNHSITVYGRAFTDTSEFALNSLVFDFGEDIELLASPSPVWTDQPLGLFKVNLPIDDWDYSDAYFDKVETSIPDGEFDYAQEPLFPELKVSVKTETAFSIQGNWDQGTNHPKPTETRLLKPYGCNNFIIDCDGNLQAWMNWLKLVERVKYDVEGTGAEYGLLGIAIVGTTNTVIDVVVPVNVLDLIPAGKVLSRGRKVFIAGVEYIYAKIPAKNWASVKKVLYTLNLKGTDKTVKKLFNYTKQVDYLENTILSAEFQALKNLPEGRTTGFVNGLLENINKNSGKGGIKKQIAEFSPNDTKDDPFKSIESLVSGVVNGVKQGKIALSIKGQGHTLLGLEFQADIPPRYYSFLEKATSAKKQFIDITYRAANTNQLVFVEVKTGSQGGRIPRISTTNGNENGNYFQAIRSFAAASEQGAQMKFVYEATNEEVKRELKTISQKFTYPDGRPFNFDPARDVLTFEQLGYRYGN